MAAEITRIGIALVEQHGQFLVGVREADTILAGKHEFPGGKCEGNESPAECAVRECREETGLVVEARGILAEIEHEYPHGRLQLTFVRCEPVDPAAAIADRFHWVPRAELRGLNFPAANAAVVDRLVDSL